MSPICNAMTAIVALVLRERFTENVVFFYKTGAIRIINGDLSPDKQPDLVSSVLKIFSILQAAGKERETGIAELSQRVIRSKSTVCLACYFFMKPGSQPEGEQIARPEKPGGLQKRQNALLCRLYDVNEPAPEAKITLRELPLPAG